MAATASPVSEPAPPSTLQTPSPTIASAYDGSTATYRLLRAFHWGPTLMSLGYFPFRGPLRYLNALCDLSQAQRRLAEKSIELLDVGEGHDVLDVACGRGATSYFIAQRNSRSRVVGVDYLHENIDAARTLFTGAPRLEYRQGDAMQLDFPDATFDRVHCLEAAFHFTDKPRFIHECARVLRPGGKLVLVDIVWRSAADRLRSDEHHADELKRVWQFDDLFAREEYAECAARSGLEITAEHDWSRCVMDPLVSLLTLAVRLAQRPWGRRLLEFCNPHSRSIDDASWSELERSAAAYRHQRPLGMYWALVARRSDASTLPPSENRRKSELRCATYVDA